MSKNKINRKLWEATATLARGEDTQRQIINLYLQDEITAKQIYKACKRLGHHWNSYHQYWQFTQPKWLDAIENSVQIQRLQPIPTELAIEAIKSRSEAIYAEEDTTP